MAERIAEWLEDAQIEIFRFAPGAVSHGQNSERQFGGFAYWNWQIDVRHDVQHGGVVVTP
jgi:hypothetical protein